MSVFFFGHLVYSSQSSIALIFYSTLFMQNDWMQFYSFSCHQAIRMKSYYYLFTDILQINKYLLDISFILKYYSIQLHRWPWNYISLIMSLHSYEIVEFNYIYTISKWTLREISSNKITSKQKRTKYWKTKAWN